MQARVVLVANIDVDRGLVNGAAGSVVGFDQVTGATVADDCRWPRVKLCACSCHACVVCGVQVCVVNASMRFVLVCVLCASACLFQELAACRTQRKGLSQATIACSLIADRAIGSAAPARVGEALVRDSRWTERAPQNRGSQSGAFAAWVVPHSARHPRHGIRRG